MKNLIKAAAILCFILISNITHSNVGVPICLRFQGTYNDHNMGVELTQQSAYYRMSKIPVHINIRKPNGSSEKITDWHTDNNGCLPALNIDTGDRITLTAFFKLEDKQNDRSITFLANNAGFEEGSTKNWDGQSAQRMIHIFTYSNPFAFVPEQYWDQIDPTITIEIASPSTSIINLLAAASSAINRGSTLGWQEGQHIFVASGDNPVLCDLSGGASAKGLDDNGIHRICISTSMMDRKQTIIHEIGHEIARKQNGPLGNNYNGNIAAPYPNHNFCTTTGSHALHSREWIGAAAQEGYADFTAIITFNRIGSVGEFSIPHNSFNRFGLRIHQWDQILLAPDSAGNYERYTREVCRPPDTFSHLGSRKDWVHFFWGLWNAGDNINFHVNEINQIWSDSKNDILKDPWLTGKEYIRHSKMRNKAFCAPITTTGEDGWSCKIVPWSYPYRYVETTVTSIPSGSGAGYNVQTTLKTVSRAATEHHTGQKWFALEEIAAFHYNKEGEPGFNRAKYENFERTAERAGVVYP